MPPTDAGQTLPSLPSSHTADWTAWQALAPLAMLQPRLALVQPLYDHRSRFCQRVPRYALREWIR
ncbi:hypothetical protein [Haloarcula halophila]|uniref:hypothetical protein n=1 Tax=Haloarcula TaxID=2237 RepID=UPI0023E429C0|nr:hypothetical protein [Halomicroarcula sp. DFY41]